MQRQPDLDVMGECSCPLCWLLVQCVEPGAAALIHQLVAYLLAARPCGAHQYARLLRRSMWLMLFPFAA